MTVKEILRVTGFAVALVMGLLLFATFCGELLVNTFTFFPQSGMQAELGELEAPVESIFIETEDGVRVSAFYLPQEGARRTVLFFHGNAGNASHRLDHAVALWRRAANVLLMDYRGYGLSDGEPSEAGIYLDGEAGLGYLTEEKGIPLHQIIVFGRSLGSAVAVHIAQHRELAGVILVSPLSSGNDVADEQGLGWLSPSLGQPFASSTKIDALRAPLLIIHGDRDDVLPHKMGRLLFDRAKVKKEFITIPGAGHNDLIAVNPELFYNGVERFLDAVTGSTVR